MKSRTTPTILGLITLIFVTACAPANEKAEEESMPSQSPEECLAKLLQPSRQLIQRMAADGVDLSKPRAVTHLLVGPNTAVQNASKLFRERRFDILEAGDGRLLLGDEVPLSDQWVSQIVPAMCSKAAEFGLSYDGWDVDMSSEKKSSDKS